MGRLNKPHPLGSSWIALLVLAGACPAPGKDTGSSSFPGDFVPPDGFWTYTGAERLLVTEVDAGFQAGTYSVADPVSGTWVVQGSPAHSDAVAACAGPWLLVVNRMAADNLQFVDPETGRTVAQWSTGNGTNPQAAVFYKERAFVSLYEVSWLLVADWMTGVELQRVDLSAWSDGDGVPEASQMFFAEGFVWVVLQRMDRATWRPAVNGILLGIDPESLAVVREIPLPVPDPTGSWQVSDSEASTGGAGAYITEAGDAMALDGGAFLVDLALGVADLVLPESTVGRNVYDAIIGDSSTWLSTYDADWENRLEIWDIASGSLVDTMGSGFFTGWAPTPEGVLWVADFEASLLRTFDMESGAEGHSTSTVLKPSSIVRCAVE